MTSRRHPTVTLTRSDGYVAEIDEDLAGLIGELWDRGFHTDQCCQEVRPGRAWIAFPGVGDALGFLAAVGLREGENGSGLASRAIGGAGVEALAGPPHEPLFGEWIWTAAPAPWRDDFAIGVEFPRDHIAELEARLAC